jgi:hypothetical protein
MCANGANTAAHRVLKLWPYGKAHRLPASVVLANVFNYFILLEP